MQIKNTSRRPLKVPLPGGKRLFLKPGGTGQIHPKAAEYPPVKELIDDGGLEILGDGRNTNQRLSGGKGPGINSSQDSGSSGIRRTGDR